MKDATPTVNLADSFVEVRDLRDASRGEGERISSPRPHRTGLRISHRQ